MKKLNSSGFNFIEVLIVVAIIGIALIPLINLFMTSFRMNKAGYYYLQANLCAQEILELIKEEKSSIDFTHTPMVISEKKLGYKFNDSFSKYSPTATIKLSDYDFEKLYEVAITIKWKEQGKKYKTTTYALISNNRGNFFKVGDS
jgi:prepilin-type N-terminal cleavage/methylation domain-containing protein